MYQHLNLKGWPFQVVPDAEFATIWAGRPQTKQQLERLLWKMQFAPKSGLHLLWANFGMGKTHTLLHLQHLSQQSQGGLVPVYAVMPRRAKGFLEVYRAVVSALPYAFLGDRLVDVGNSWSGSLTFHPMFSKSPGIVNAILALRGNDAEKATIARQWLIAQPGLTTRDLRTVGVSYRMRTPEDAINALSALTRLASFQSKSSTKLVVMLDEYQRIGELRPLVMNEINSGLHSYFNEHSKGLELILSFSFGREDNVAYLLSDELKSRAEPQSISLDVLSQEEAIEFIRDLLTQFRIQEDGRWAYPFSPKAVETLVEHIAKAKALTPRRLMLYANHVVLESQMERGPGSTDEITLQEVRELLADPRLGALDVDEPNMVG